MLTVKCEMKSKTMILNYYGPLYLIVMVSFVSFGKPELPWFTVFKTKDLAGWLFVNLYFC